MLVILALLQLCLQMINGFLTVLLRHNLTFRYLRTVADLGVSPWSTGSPLP